MSSWIQIIGWTLVHFVWQGSVIAIATAMVLRIGQRHTARLRYAIASSALLLMALTPAFTTLRLAVSFTPSWHAAAEARAQTFVAASRMTEPMLDGVFATAQSRLQPVEDALPVLVTLWFVGVAAFLARAVLQWRHIRGLHKSALLLRRSRWQAGADRLADRLGLRQAVRIVELPSVDVPTVIGWLRPIVLLPLAAVSQLPVSQVEAVIAHELAHVRRHDYLINLLQTGVEAVLFYHPAVWWLSARIRHERELCCDDIAGDMCGDRVTYATALVEFESRRRAMAGAVIGVHATGGQLRRRIRRVLSPPAISDPATPGWSIVCAAGILMAVMTVANIVAAQNAPPRLEFEAASIKPNHSGMMRVSARTLPGGGYQGFNITLGSLLQQAYGLPEYLVVGGPDWLRRDRYDVVLKSPAEQNASRPEAFRSRLRSLFADRTKLATHFERRDTPIYILVPVRSDRALGREIAPSKTGCDSVVEAGNEPKQDATPPLGRIEAPPCDVLGGGGRILGSARTMADIARALQGPSGRVVQDRTGIEGRFDFTLTFTRDPNIAGSRLGGGLPGNVERTQRIDPDALSVFTAVQEQLGLKLESARGPVDHLVIDSIEKPTEN
jgi:uncharacterized protein (TIGR03435 family)